MKKVIASTLICSSLLLAANSDYNYEITPMIGGVKSEGNLDLKNQKNYGVSIGRNLSGEHIFDQVELGILNSTNTDYSIGNEDTKILRIFANVIKDYKLSEKTSLYTLVGLGYEKFSTERFDNESDGFANYGIGLKYKLSENLSLKTDVRHLITFEGNNNLLYTVGLGISFGKKAKPVMKKEMPVMKETKKEVPMPAKHVEVSDKDKDGVLDNNDICPQSPAGVTVGVRGCELDDDKDGIVNSHDKCPNTIKGAFVDNTGCVVTVDLSINFDTDSSIINNTYDNKIKEFATFLKRNPSVKARIEAHTDATGSKKYNEKLSQRRAAATVKELTNLNINSSRLEAIGYGELKAIASNKTKEGRAQNRRVEAVIIK